MTQLNSDSFRNPLRYQGQDYAFVPLYYRQRDPTVLDVKPKEQTGYYLVGSQWVNTSNGNIWFLTGFTTVANVLNAIWELLTTEFDSGILKIATPDGSSPVVPTNAGLVNFTSADNSVIITGSTNTVDFSINNAPVSWTPQLRFGTGVNSTFTTQKGTYLVVGKLVYVYAQITINALGTSAGNANINAAGGGSAPSIPTNNSNFPAILTMTMDAGINLDASYTSIYGTIPTGSKQINIIEQGANQTSSSIDASYFSNGSSFQLWGMYYTN